MADTNRIGTRSQIDSLGIDAVGTRPAPVRTSGGARAAGRRPGMRMLAPDVDVETLDRTAPRGTYLDILV